MSIAELFRRKREGSPDKLYFLRQSNGVLLIFKSEAARNAYMEVLRFYHGNEKHAYEAAGQLVYQEVLPDTKRKENGRQGGRKRKRQSESRPVFLVPSGGKGRRVVVRGPENLAAYDYVQKHVTAQTTGQKKAILAMFTDGEAHSYQGGIQVFDNDHGALSLNRGPVITKGVLFKRNKKRWWERRRR